MCQACPFLLVQVNYRDCFGVLPKFCGHSLKTILDLKGYLAKVIYARQFFKFLAMTHMQQVSTSPKPTFIMMTH